MVDEFAGGEDLRAFGEELVEQGVMQFEIDVRAAVLDDDEAVVGVSGLEEGGEDDAAGGDAEEDERFDIIGAKDHFKVGACEGADAVLGDDDVVGLRSDRGVDRACGALEEALMLWRGLDGGEEKVAGADFWKIETKADLHVDDAQSGSAGALQDGCGAGAQFLILDVDRDDAGLQVHAEEGGAAGSIDSCAGMNEKSLRLIFVTFVAMENSTLRADV